MTTNLQTQDSSDDTANESRQVTRLSGDALISFVSATSTNIGKSTFYNLKEEQRQALIDQHAVVMDNARAFYALMALPKGVNDANKQLIAYNLIKNKVREDGLKDHEHSPTTKWENELIFQVLDNMQPNRVFDLFQNLIKNKGLRRSRFIMLEYLQRNKRSWELWAIKYRKDFKAILRHAHTGGDETLLKLWRYLKYDEMDGFRGVIKDYEAVKGGDQSKLAKLPISVAEGFAQKFGLSKADFEKLFSEGGRKTHSKGEETPCNLYCKGRCVHWLRPRESRPLRPLGLLEVS